MYEIGPLMYPDEIPVREALADYFAQYHFKDGGYNDRWFHLKIGRLMIPFPNIPARVEAVKLHDLHHVITGYRADRKGEVEIGAWELGGGCGRYWVAWLLNAEVALIGLFLYPRALFFAFRSGRGVPNNLYHGVAYEGLLDKTVGQLRTSILERPVRDVAPRV